MAEEAKQPDSPAKPKYKVKARQVQAYYKLLVELGMADYIEKAQEQSQARSTRTPITAAEQTAQPEDFSKNMLQVIDMTRFFKALAEDNRVIEFITIVMDCSEEEAAETDMDTLESFFGDFVAQSMTPIVMLLGSGKFMGP